MKELGVLIDSRNIIEVIGSEDKNISYISDDSRNILPDSLFIAKRGLKYDGHDYIDHAINEGAVAVVCEEVPGELRDGITYIVVSDVKRAILTVLKSYYGSYHDKIKLIAVTGTNGKTTTSYLLYQLLQKLGYKAGLISTIGNYILEERHTTSLTTPGIIELYRLINTMIESGVQYCILETSSHAIRQGRIEGLSPVAALFTNISHDHLDYHADFKDYINTKKKLFDDLPADSLAIYNTDDPNGTIMVQNTKATTIPYSIHSDTEHKCKIVVNSIEGMELKIGSDNVWVKLIGHFNAYNLLAVYTLAVSMGLDRDRVLTLLSELEPPKGRFQVVKNNRNVFSVIDYAHTPEALKSLLSTINQIKEKESSTITVVGCGGNRDVAKRPLMGKIASKLSEKVIFTSDNPREEDPSDIITEMQSLLDSECKNRTISIIDREEAIKTACLMAQERDIVVVVGKGHEDYQEIKGEYKPFDDLLVLRNMSK